MDQYLKLALENVEKTKLAIKSLQGQLKEEQELLYSICPHLDIHCTMMRGWESTHVDRICQTCGLLEEGWTGERLRESPYPPVEGRKITWVNR